MTRRLLLLLAALAAGLVLAGCGGDDEGDGDSATAAETPAEDGDSGKLVIEAERGAFDAQAVFESAAPGVVTISSIFPNGTNPLGGTGPQAGQGSGFVISDEGEIVTNAHVVTDGQAEGSSEINAAREVYVQFPDRNQVEAEIVGFDPFADVALLKVDPDGLEIDPIELGSLEDVAVGSPVAAIGSPFGERQSLSVGVISATNRSIPSLTEFQIDGAIQTDASINPGNSGGPLLDAESKVIGINQQIDTTSGGNQGVGFAVPIDLAVARDRAAARGRQGGLRVHRRHDPAALSAARRGARDRHSHGRADRERRRWRAGRRRRALLRRTRRRSRTRIRFASRRRRS